MANLIKRIVEVFERNDVVVKIQDERPVLRGTPECHRLRHTV